MPRKHFLTQAQLGSLTSPIRLAIVQRLEIDRQATARELADRMGRPVTSLYHHIKQMAEIGLLRVTGQRKGSRRPEAVYAMVADYLSSAEVVKTRAGKKTYGRAVLRVAEASARTFSAAMERGNPVFDGERRNAMVRFYLLRADKQKIARLNTLLDELDDVAARSCDDGEEIQLTVLLTPLSGKG
jgi:predicted ArsR family transcriptional regulator